jgi:hypothetical protein
MSGLARVQRGHTAHQASRGACRPILTLPSDAGEVKGNVGQVGRAEAKTPQSDQLQVVSALQQ